MHTCTALHCSKQFGVDPVAQQDVVYYMINSTEVLLKGIDCIYILLSLKAIFTLSCSVLA